MTFSTFSFDKRIAASIEACGYTTPTPIQDRAIPEVLAGRDVMGLAQTGTGKTAAFALPILQRLTERHGQGFRQKTGPVRVLVLAPTRELAQQIHENFATFGKSLGFRSAPVFGGVGFGPQISAARKATVLVACPGRLLDLLNKGSIRLNQVHTLVLDEADRMLDMGFLPDIKRILAGLPKERQNLLFSATMPEDIRRLSQDILQDPVVVQVDNTAPAKSVSHGFYPMASQRKNAFIEAWLRDVDYDSVLVFTKTKHKAKNLAEKLEKQGHKATFLQGNLSQNRRTRAIEGFRSGRYRIMVATDIAARGIDCSKISHVINFDLPDTAETYTHRIGRTGRAGRTGQALTLVTDQDRDMVRAIERVLGQRVDRLRLEGFDPGATDRNAGQRGDRQGFWGNSSRGRNAGGNGQGRNGSGRNGAGRNAGGRDNSGRNGAGRNANSRSASEENGAGRSDNRRAAATRSGQGRGRDADRSGQGFEPVRYGQGMDSSERDSRGQGRGQGRGNTGGRAGYGKSRHAQSGNQGGGQDGNRGKRARSNNR